MTDREWLELIKAGDETAWKRIWERVVEPESRSLRSAGMMKRFSLDAAELMSMLFEEMIGRKKIELFRGEGSLEGWLKRYVRGYVLNADPNKHGEISIEGAHPDSEHGRTEMEIPVAGDRQLNHNEVWDITHRCFYDLWREDPERCYIHLLKTRFFLTSDEIRDFLDVSTSANVDQIFSRSVKFLRSRWIARDPKWS
jgi:hypothetical protein